MNTLDRLVDRSFKYVVWGVIIIILIPAGFRAVFGISWQKWLGV